ncbi:MAG: DUF2231 domain-containing protein [candidate division NC10 bacterium]|nr:DUF2231 domain-containing protein [candidate division NC10 bacterium]
MFGFKISPLHPPVVHFVVGFAVASVLFEFVGLVFRRQALRRTGFHLLILAGVVMGLAIWAGLEDAEGISLTDKTGRMIVQHRNLAFFTAGSYGLFLLLQIVERWKYRMQAVPTGLRILSILAALAGLILVGVTGWYGGELVFRQGVNVG